MADKKVAKADKVRSKHTFRIVPVDGTRTVAFSVTFDKDGSEHVKTFASRADLFAWVRGAEMFDVRPKVISRSVVQTVTVELPEA